MHTLGAQDNGRTLSLGLDDEVRIELPEHATAGFRWNLLADAGPAFKLVEDARTPPAGRAGGAGSHHWQLRAAQPGSVVFKAAYARTFGDAAPDSEFSVRLDVRKSP